MICFHLPIPFTYHQLSETPTPPTYHFFFKYRMFAMMFIRTPIKTTIPPIFLTMIALMKLPGEVIYNVDPIGLKKMKAITGWTL